MRGDVLLLVTDEYYASLAAMRALAAAGYSPWVAATVDDGFAQRSRTAAGLTRVPHPREGEAFIEALAGLARTVGAAAVLPGNEASVLALSGRADALPEGVALGVSPPDSLVLATDKSRLSQLAAAAGLRSPPSLRLRAADLAVDAAAIRYPAVLKPACSAITVDGRTLELPHAERVESPSVLTERVEQYPEVDWLVQPYVAGRLVAVAGVAWRGRVVCSVHQEARRIYPSDCGVTAFAETVPRDESLEEALHALHERLGLSGIWEAQFLAGGDERYLIDLNPRLYGSLALAVAAGANLPAVWADLVLGRPPRPAPYRAGVRFRAEPRELGLLAEAFRRRRPGAAAAILAPRRRTAHAVFSLRDPAPTALLSRRVVRRARG